MAQSYPNIAASDLISASRVNILARDDANRSNNAGTTFPVSDLVVGMGCYRTDLKKYYVLEQISPVIWRELPLAINLGSGAYATIGVSGDTVPKNNTLNVWSAKQTFNAEVAVGAQQITGTSGSIKMDADVRLNALSTKIINFLINNVSRMSVQTDGGVVIGAPTGNSFGAGSINVQSLYVNGEGLSGLAFKAALDASEEIGNGILNPAHFANNTPNTYLGFDASGVPGVYEYVSPNLEYNREVFSTVGAHSWVKPAGVSSVRIRMCGGGGGGAGSGGSAGSPMYAGSAGSSSSFGTNLVTATGGLGGVTTDYVDGKGSTGTYGYTSQYANETRNGYGYVGAIGSETEFNSGGNPFVKPNATSNLGGYNVGGIGYGAFGYEAFPYNGSNGGNGGYIDVTLDLSAYETGFEFPIVVGAGGNGGSYGGNGRTGVVIVEWYSFAE